MSKPTLDRNAGADAAFRCVYRVMDKRQKQYESDKLPDQAYVVTELRNLVKAARRRTSKRRGGIGRK